MEQSHHDHIFTLVFSILIKNFFVKSATYTCKFINLINITNNLDHIKKELRTMLTVQIHTIMGSEQANPHSCIIHLLTCLFFLYLLYKFLSTILSKVCIFFL